MREIKFRVWDGVDYMSSPFDLKDLQTGIVQFASDAVVMQFTGLKDCKGREIYEGDIVQWWYDYSSHHAYRQKRIAKTVVEFDNGMFKVGTSESEVIGNIFENPDLIK